MAVSAVAVSGVLLWQSLAYCCVSLWHIAVAVSGILLWLSLLWLSLAYCCGSLWHIAVVVSGILLWLSLASCCGLSLIDLFLFFSAGYNSISRFIIEELPDQIDDECIITLPVVAGDAV